MNLVHFEGVAFCAGFAIALSCRGVVFLFDRVSSMLGSSDGLLKTGIGLSRPLRSAQNLTSYVVAAFLRLGGPQKEQALDEFPMQLKPWRSLTTV